MDHVRYRFGEFELDTGSRELSSPDGVISTERQVFEVLTRLVEHRDRVVPKTELLDTIWGDRFVSESALSTRIKEARRALGDDGDRQEWIRTIRGVGYRFVGTVDEIATTSPTEVAVLPQERRAHVAPPPERLIGRDAAAARLAAQLDHHRLVSVVGTGGIGKTHLVRHVGASIAERWTDGAVMVELAHVAEDAAVAPTTVQQLGAPQYADVSVLDALLAHLQPRHGLLILDSAEHVRAGTAELCSTILASCPRITVAVTSRERLGIDGERLIPLGPLRLDDSIELFSLRAAAHSVDLDENEAALLALCQRLDGVPLAIQLAAARARMLSLTDIAARLDDHLRSDAIESADRHATMERAIAWSFESLPTDDQAALCALSNLRGAFDVNDATAVVGRDALDLIVRLVERSLVITVDGHRSRFRILEPIRLFAAQRQGDDDRSRYVAHLVASVTDACDRMERGDIDSGAAELADRWPNVRRALEVAIDRGDAEAARQLVASLASYAEVWLHVEVADWALAAVGTDHEDPASIQMFAVTSRILAHTGARDRASALVDRIAEAPATSDVVLARLWSRWYRGDVDGALEQLEIFEEQLDRPTGLTALGLQTLRVFAITTAGRPDSSHLWRLRSMASSVGDSGLPLMLFAEGVEAFWAARFADALEPFDRSVDAATQRGQMLFASGIASFRTIALAAMIDEQRAVDRLTASLRNALDANEGAVVIGNVSLIADLTVAALALVVRNETTIAGQLLGVRDGNAYRAGSSELVALNVAALLDERGVAVERDRQVGAGLDLREAAALALRALSRITPDVP
ncbi:MAG: winged helix-turn-helix domain-containing protein [Actinomycetota bacterium]